MWCYDCYSKMQTYWKAFELLQVNHMHHLLLKELVDLDVSTAILRWVSFRPLLEI